MIYIIKQEGLYKKKTSTPASFPPVTVKNYAKVTWGVFIYTNFLNLKSSPMNKISILSVLAEKVEYHSVQNNDYQV